ncbi:MAG: hypothetical protein NXH75_15880 [Halobacteriovoraceae bacterium]|nr:hypothetical protein [Halobacteriovoraceae bacterium]
MKFLSIALITIFSTATMAAANQTSMNIPTDWAVMRCIQGNTSTALQRRHLAVNASFKVIRYDSSPVSYEVWMRNPNEPQFELRTTCSFVSFKQTYGPSTL